MRTNTILLAAAVAALLAGCSRSDSPGFAMRNTGGISAEQAVMKDQAEALQLMTKDIVRKSTTQGATLGAFAGCGLVVLSASNAKNCLGGAAVGAIAGAVAGNASGQKQVQKKIELVSPSVLVRSIGKSTEQVDQIQMSLPSLLAAQDIELAELTQKMERGEITEDGYAERASAIRAERSDLTKALSISAANAQTAHDNLLAAQAQGQTGLDWHLSATKALARDVTSARSTIDLL